MNAYRVFVGVLVLAFVVSSVVSMRAIVEVKDSANCTISWRLSGGAYVLKCATDNCDSGATPNCYIFAFTSGGHQHYSCACCAGVPPGTGCNTPTAVICYGDIDANDPNNYTVVCTAVTCAANIGCLVNEPTSSWQPACYCP